MSIYKVKPVIYLFLFYGIVCCVGVYDNRYVRLWLR